MSPVLCFSWETQGSASQEDVISEQISASFTDEVKQYRNFLRQTLYSLNEGVSYIKRYSTKFTLKNVLIAFRLRQPIIVPLLTQQNRLVLFSCTRDNRHSTVEEWRRVALSTRSSEWWLWIQISTACCAISYATV